MPESKIIPLTYSIDENFDNDKFLKLRLKVCHNARSLHNTKFKKSALENAKDSIANIPILTHVIENADGDLDFGGHDIEIETDRYDSNKFREIFLEQPVGVIPETNNYEVVEEDGISYVYCDGYIWKGYSNYCVDILENNDRIKLSMEVDFIDFHFSPTDDCYIITDFKYLGITLLGSQCRPAMQNSGADITSYSIDDRANKIVTVEELRSEIYKAISATNVDQKKGVDKMDFETKQKILDEYKVSESELGFEISDDMTETDLRTKIDEYVAAKNANTGDFTAENTETISDCGSTDNESIDTSDSPDQNNSVTPDSQDDTDTVSDKVSYYSIGNKTVSFAMSDEDKREGIYRALSEVSDDEYWIIQTYDDNVIVQSWLDGKFYKIGFSKTDSKIELNADWVEVFAEFVTENEKIELEQLRNNYNQLESEVNELREYKDNTESELREKSLASIFEKFDTQLSESVDYLNLKNDNAKYSIEEVEEKCYALIGKLNAKFSVDNSSILTVGYRSHTSTDEAKDKPYNGLYDLLKDK